MNQPNQDTKYSVIEGDNYCGDYPDEKLIASGLTKTAAETQAMVLNSKLGQHHDRWHFVEPDGYELQPGFEP